MSPSAEARSTAALVRIPARRRLDAIFLLLCNWAPLQQPAEWKLFRAAHRADYRLEGGVHLIRINLGLGYAQAVDGMLHEYAHALTDEVHGPDQPFEHSAEWGVNYARCYRIWEEHWNGFTYP